MAEWNKNLQSASIETDTMNYVDDNELGYYANEDAQEGINSEHDDISAAEFEPHKNTPRSKKKEEVESTLRQCYDQLEDTVDTMKKINPTLASDFTSLIE